MEHTYHLHGFFPLSFLVLDWAVWVFGPPNKRYKKEDRDLRMALLSNMDLELHHGKLGTILWCSESAKVVVETVRKAMHDAGVDTSGQLPLDIEPPSDSAALKYHNETMANIRAMVKVRESSLGPLYRPPNFKYCLSVNRQLGVKAPTVITEPAAGPSNATKPARRVRNACAQG